MQPQQQDIKKSVSISSLSNMSGPRIEVMNEKTRTRLGLDSSRSSSMTSLNQPNSSGNRVRAGSAASLLAKGGIKGRLNTL